MRGVDVMLRAPFRGAIKSARCLRWQGVQLRGNIGRRVGGGKTVVRGVRLDLPITQPWFQIRVQSTNFIAL